VNSQRGHLAAITLLHRRSGRHRQDRTRKRSESGKMWKFWQITYLVEMVNVVYMKSFNFFPLHLVQVHSSTELFSPPLLVPSLLIPKLLDIRPILETSQTLQTKQL
jgi:hypothetical protein